MDSLTAVAPMSEVALFRHVPALAGEVPWARLGRWPTPVEPLALGTGGPPLYVKREDLSSPRYGGNKVRTLEPVLGYARQLGADAVWATGAYGSNHALATALHAPRVGLRPGAMLFPQPRSDAACANADALLAARPDLLCLPTVLALPAAMAWLRRRHPRDVVMAPGAATPRGALGALSGALELAEQVAAGVCPPPARIVLAVGSTCTTAGLLAGLHLAAHLGIAFTRAIPRVTAVRVTPWPITSAARVALLAHHTGRLVARLAPGSAAVASFATLYAALTVDGRYIGPGYGGATAAGYRAQRAFAEAGGPPLDEVYSAKSGAALCDLAAEHAQGPILFWATKSSAPLVRARSDVLSTAPARLRTWLRASPNGDIHRTSHVGGPC